MLRYALLESGSLISIEDTSHSPPYFCPDCLASLGKKRGPERSWHFFHYDTQSKFPCKRQGNIQEHAALQEKIYQELILQNAGWVIEHPIPEAKRIADLALPSEKIAIEIQRSPLSLDSFLERSEAYWKQGWSVLWFVSLSLYQTSPLPRQIESMGIVPYYFLEEEGCILWDTLVIHRGEILQRPLSSITPQKVLTSVLKGHKRDQWTIHLKGDFLDSPPDFPQTRERVWKKRLKTTLSLLWFRLLSG